MKQNQAVIKQGHVDMIRNQLKTLEIKGCYWHLKLNKWFRHQTGHEERIHGLKAHTEESPRMQHQEIRVKMWKRS